MASLENSEGHATNLAPIRWLGFIALIFAYLYLLLDPKLIFFGHGTVVRLRTFLDCDDLTRDLWVRPGGVGEFATAHLMRYFGLAWAGPAIFALVVCLLCISADRLLASVHGKGMRGVGTIPAILLLALMGRYARPFFCMAYAVPMVAALTLAALYTFAPRRTFIRLPALALLSVTIYWLGAGTLLLFAAVCVIHEILGRRRVVLGVFALVLGVVLPYLGGCLIYDVPLREAYLRLTPFDPSVQWNLRSLHCILYMFVPIGMVGACLMRGRGDTRHTWTLESLALLVGAAAVAGLSFDRGLRTLLDRRAAGAEAWMAWTRRVDLPLAHCALILGAAVFLALLAAGLCARLPFQRPVLRLAIFLISCLAVYYYAAGAGTLLFGALCVLYELLLGRRRGLALAYAIGLLVPAAALAIAAMNTDALGRYAGLLALLPGWDPRVAPIARRLLVVVPFAAAALAAWYGRSARGERASRALGRSGAWACHSLLLLVVGAAAIGAMFDWQKNARLRLNYFARMGRWENVLSESLRLRRPSAAVRLDVQRALYHTGRLTEDMFSYPYSLLGLPRAWSWQEMSLYAEMYFEMGHMNAAEEHAFANLASGDHPLVLLLLGRIYLVKGRPASAWVFLNALKHDPSCGDWADEYLDRLRADPRLASDWKDKHLRSLAIRKEAIFKEGHKGEGKALLDLLEANPANRMAFEFRMASLLLAKRLDEFVANLPNVEAAGCRGKLRLYQEAFLVQANDAEAEAVGIRVGPETRQRFREFQQARASAKTPADRRRIAKRFGDSYFYYHEFGERVRP